MFGEIPQKQQGTVFAINAAYTQANTATTLAVAANVYAQSVASLAGTSNTSAQSAANLVAVYANSSLVMANANVNFNNTASVQVVTDANGANKAANVSFTAVAASNTGTAGIAALDPSPTSVSNTNAATAFIVSAVGTNALAAYAQANTANTNAAAANVTGQSGITLAVSANTTAQAAANLVAVYANNTLTMANANVNFNNTASVQVAVAANSANKAANVSFTVVAASNTGTAGIAALDPSPTSVSNVNAATAFAVSAVGTNALAAYAQANTVYSVANSAANTVATFANGTVVLANANLNFNNTASVNVVAAANGTTQSNVSFTANATFIASVGASNDAIAANGTVVVSTSNANFNNTATINVAVGANGTQGNISFTANGTYIASVVASNDATYANGTIVVATSNVNFNNTASVNVTASANGATQSNISFTTNATAIAAVSAANDYIFANGTVVVNTSNTNFNNTASINVAASANGTGQGNISFVANASYISSFGPSAGPIAANGTTVVTTSNINFNNTATLNTSVLANGTQGNVSFSINTNPAYTWGGLHTFGGNATVNGVVTMNSVLRGTVITTPSANTMAQYSRNIANSMMLFTTTPAPNNSLTCPDSVDQHSMAYKSVFIARPAKNLSVTNTSVFTALGWTPNVKANTAFANILPGNAVPILKSSMARTQLGANNIATGNCGVLANANLVWGGGSTGNGGGYLTVIRFAIDANGAAQNNFAGMANIVAMPVTAIDWTQNTNYDIIGLACNCGAGVNWSINYGLNGAARTSTDLGANFNYNTTDVIELTIFVNPGGASGGYRVRNLSNGAESQGTITTNLPDANHFMQPIVQMFNNTTTAANLSIMTIYVETDY